MKNFLMLLLAFVVVYLVWHVVMGLISSVIGTIISIGLILLFCYFVYAVFRMLAKQSEC